MQRYYSAGSHCSMIVFIKENSWVARIAAKKMKSDKVAIVFGKTIHLHNTSRAEFIKDDYWVCHELKHVEQYHEYGFIGFLARYFFQCLKHGYYNNKFEIEARRSENDRILLEQYQIA